MGLGDEAAVDFEAVLAGEERGGGFVVADLGVERVAVGGGDIGWVGDDSVKGFAEGQRAEEIGFEEADVREIVASGVGCGNFKGCW